MTEFFQQNNIVELALNFGTFVLSVALITIIGGLVAKLGMISVEKFFRDKNRMFKNTNEHRLNTLQVIMKSAIRYVIYFIAAVMVLEKFGLDTGSLIAAAGVGGIAIGFGAQSLIRDLVTGFFILLEDHYDVGDFVTVSGVSGVVEEMGVRVTRVRDFGGQLHIIPNGTIEQVTNHMGSGMRVLVNVDIAYEVDVNHAIGVLQELFSRLATEIEDLVEGPKVLGVDDLGNSGVTLKTWAKAKPMTQWAVEREIRKHIKLTFDEHGIEIPYPRRHLVFDKSYQETVN